MQTVNASVILGDAYHLIGWDADQLETRQKQQARAALSMALQEVWESWWWQELMKCEQISGATVYAAADTYALGDVVYYPASKTFYQAMQETTGNAPASLETDGSYTPNYQYWALALAEPTAGDWSETEEYELGDQVRSPGDGLVYQLIMEPPLYVNISGAGVSAADGQYYQSGTFGGKASYVKTNLAFVITWLSGQVGLTDGWVISYNGGAPIYKSESDTDTPFEATNWYSVGADQLASSANDPVPTISESYLTPVPPADFFGASVWGLLTAFTPTITIDGDVRGIGKHDLRNSPNGFAYDFEKTLDGYRIPGWAEDVPWVWYRRPVPIITGDDYSSTATYTAAETITFD